MTVMQFLICKMEILYGEKFLRGADFYFKLVVKKNMLIGNTIHLFMLSVNGGTKLKHCGCVAIAFCASEYKSLLPFRSYPLSMSVLVKHGVSCLIPQMNISDPYRPTEQ